MELALRANDATTLVVTLAFRYIGPDMKKWMADQMVPTKMHLRILRGSRLDAEVLWLELFSYGGKYYGKAGDGVWYVMEGGEE